MKNKKIDTLWSILKWIVIIIVATIQSFGASLLVKKVAIGVIVVLMFISMILHYIYYIEKGQIRYIILFIIFEIIYALAMSWYVLTSKQS